MSEGPMVLLIDDEVQIRRFLRISLETNGYRVHESARGDDGLAEAARLRPDLIVLDLGLPGLEGLEVL
ncbi:MAG TPA: response regulator, partial [Anaerolineales bacterium]|nr:response regulator [Anaerolineales bacterium]